jgi:hypothetical protein
MLAGRELVALMYRADWTNLSLSGEVSGSDQPLLTFLADARERHRESGGNLPPFPFEPGATRQLLTRLVVAPGQRYRADNQDGRFASARGCDGEQVWQWFQYPPPPPGEVHFSGRPKPPFPTLLCPSWLLAGYDLEVAGPVPACGRDGIRLVATARRDTRTTPGTRFSPFSAWPPMRFDHVDAIVDSGLGILLRCERRKGDRAAEVIEFRSLTVDQVADPAQFTAPAGSILGEGDGCLSGTHFSGPFSGTGWEIAKTAAGLAAGGLGAAIRYSPFGPFGPLRPPRPAPPRDEDAEAAMPRDDPPPADIAERPPVSDEVLHLLQRGGAVPEFTGTFHEWFDPAGLLAAVPPSARQTGFGGVGFLVDTLGAASEAKRKPGVRHEISTVRMEGWDKYRIDRTYRTPRRGVDRARGDADWVTMACDGRQRYQVYSGRVSKGPSAPPPTELSDLADGSWLLRCELSDGGEVMAGDRRGYRIHVWRSPSVASLTGFFFRAVAVVDAESGRLRSLTHYGGAKPVIRFELRDVAPGADAGFEVPAGLPVVDEPSGHVPSGRARGDHRGRYADPPG